MTQKRSYKQYPKEFKEEAVALVTEQGYTVPRAAEVLGVAANILYRWKDNAEKQKAGITLSEDERTELKGLRQEVKTLRAYKEILKRLFVKLCGTPWQHIQLPTVEQYARSEAFERTITPSIGLYRLNL